MKKLLLLFSLLLIGCTPALPSISSKTSSIDSNTSSIKVNTSSNSSEIDYSKFDKKLAGKWYIHSSMMGNLNLNLEITIKDDYTMQIGDVKFNFIGIYDNFEDTNVFLSESGITKFIASTDGEYLDWAYEDAGGNSDFGTAKKEKLQNGIQYSYAGKAWPMERINLFLETEGNIPSYVADEYYLFLGQSQVFNNANYAMIDIFNPANEAAINYVTTLNQNGFEIKKDDKSNFYIGYDVNHIYGLRIIQFDDSLSIFIYNYQTLSTEYL